MRRVGVSKLALREAVVYLGKNNKDSYEDK